MSDSSKPERKELIVEFIKVFLPEKWNTNIFPFNTFKTSKSSTQFRFIIFHWLSDSLEGHSGSKVVDTLHPSLCVKGPSGRWLFLNFDVSEKQIWVL